MRWPALFCCCDEGGFGLIGVGGMRVWTCMAGMAVMRNGVARHGCSGNPYRVAFWGVSPLKAVAGECGDMRTFMAGMAVMRNGVAMHGCSGKELFRRPYRLPFLKGTSPLSGDAPSLWL